MSVVYCCVYNGLGNQLFGYALGRYLSKKHGKELHVDLTKLNTVNFLSKIGVKKDTPRHYELDKLGFIHPVKKFNPVEFTRKASFLNQRRYHIADFRNSHPNMDVADNKKMYSIGWGQYDIIREVVPELRENLKPNFKRTKAFKQTEDLIRTTNSVAIHIRRTDYLKAGVGNRFGGICTSQYYQNAINRILEQVDNPHFIVFSDDIEYAEKHFKLENVHIVKGNPGYADLYLMSQCRHFILANSTFSFWAAELNKYDDKIVCAPAFWYNNPLQSESYIPKEWCRIEIS